MTLLAWNARQCCINACDPIGWKEPAIGNALNGEFRWPISGRCLDRLNGGKLRNRQRELGFRVVCSLCLSDYAPTTRSGPRCWLYGPIGLQALQHSPPDVLAVLLPELARNSIPTSKLVRNLRRSSMLDPPWLSYLMVKQRPHPSNLDSRMPISIHVSSYRPSTFGTSGHPKLRYSLDPAYSHAL